MVGGGQGGVTLDLHRQRFAVAQGHDAIVQGLIAHHVRHVIGAQIRLRNRGQNADDDQVATHGFRSRLTGVPCGFEFVLEAGEDLTAECRRAAVEFHVEFGELRNHERIVQALQVGVVCWQRIAAIVNEPGFELETGDLAAVTELVVLEHLAQQCCLFIEPAAKQAEVLGLKKARFDFVTHMGCVR